MADFFRRHYLAVSITSIIAVSGSAASQAENPQFNVDISSQAAGIALMQLAKKTSVQIMMDKSVGEDINLQSIRGTYTLSQALDTLLRDTGLVYEFASDDLVVVKHGNDGSAGNSASGAKISDKEPKVIEELIVTSQRREQSILDVPISIQALDAVELENRRIENLADLSLAVPGFSVNELPNQSQTHIYMRGMGVQAGNSPMVGVYLDEMPVQISRAGTIDLRVYDLERVEVLKGPQGTLYGQGSVGGTVRFITRQPELDRFGGKADMAVSFVDDGTPTEEIKGVLNVPLVEDKLGLRIASSFAKNGGWIDQPAAGNEDINTSNLVNVRAKMLWRATDNLDITAMVNTFDSKGNYGGSGESVDGTFTQAFGWTTYPKNRSDYQLYNLLVEYDFGPMSLISSTGYMEQDSRSFEYSGVWVPGVQDFTLDAGLRGDIFVQETRLASNGDTWDWTVGAAYTRYGYTLDFDYMVGPVGAANDDELTHFGPYGGTESRSTSKAVFGEISRYLTDKIEAGIGLRYFTDDQEKELGDSGTFTALTPRMFIRYSLTDDINLYASVGEGYRSGGVNNNGLPGFEAEETLNAEIGTKSMLFDGQLRFDVAVYFSEIDGMQIYGRNPIDPFGAAYTQNGGVAEVLGVETFIEWYVTENFMLAFNGYHADTELVEKNILDSPLDVGNRMSHVPGYAHTTTAQYNFEMAGIPGFIRLDYNRRGHLVHHDNRPYASVALSRSDDIDVMNVLINWDLNDNMSLGIFGQNLANERGNLTIWEEFRMNTRQKPRTFGFNFSVEF